MKQFLHRIYLLVAIMACTTPRISFAISEADPTHQQESFVKEVLHTIQKNIDMIAPTRASKIAVAVPSLALLVTLAALWRFSKDIVAKTERNEMLSYQLKNKEEQIESDLGQIASLQITS